MRQRYAAPQALQEGCRVLMLLRICWNALQGALHIVRNAQQAAHKFLHGGPQCRKIVGDCAATWLISRSSSPATAALHLQRPAQPLSVLSDLSGIRESMPEYGTCDSA